MFKFLKLRNSDFGDARRHVPFRSIIHKPLFLILALLFSFICIVPVKVKALADPVPQFNVINGTDLNTFIGGYEAATSDIQWITNALIGAQALEYAGLGDYKISFDALPDDADIWDRLVLIGERLTDELMYPYIAADRAFTKVIDFAQGALNYAKSFASKIQFINHVNSLQNFFIEYSSDFGKDLNQYFAHNGGLNNWQYNSVYFNPGNFSFDWKQVTPAYQQYYEEYMAFFNAMPNTKVRINNTSDQTAGNTAAGGSCFTNYHNIFLNTSSHKVYLCDDNGNTIQTSQVKYITYKLYGDLVEKYDSITVYFKQFDVSNYSNINSIFLALSNNPSLLVSFFQSERDTLLISFADFVDNLYMGDSWTNKTNWSEQFDLGFSDTDSLQVLNPDPNTSLLYDLKELVNQIVQAQPDPNYELPLKPIIYNVTQVNGSPLTAEDLEGISFNVTPPESGIDVPVNVFLPLFDNGNGFISYMWYMTKPLVMYTRSFLDAITFDPVDGFNASGPGYFILGVAGLGLIGGVIVKFLL